MAEQVYTDCKWYIGKYDFSSSANMLSMEYSTEIQDATAFGDTTRVKAPGLKNLTANVEGYFEAGVDTVDEWLFSNIGVVDTPMTMCPTDGSDGERCFFINSVSGQYSPLSGAVGEMLKFTSSFEGSGGELIQGTVLKNGTVTADGNGTGYQVGAISSSEKGYALIHVTSVSASDDVDITIESDDNAGFTSATTRFTFTNVTDETSEFLVPLDGAITDDYWRAVWDVTGTGVSIDIVVVFGIK